MKLTAAFGICAIVLPSVLAGCQAKEETNDAAYVHEMVCETVNIAEKYYDSISHAPDSDFNRLMANFDNAINKINNSYPSDLYLHMHEGENDTVAKAILRVVAKRDSLLHMRPDSLALDTLPPIPYRRETAPEPSGAAQPQQKK